MTGRLLSMPNPKTVLFLGGALACLFLFYGRLWSGLVSAADTYAFADMELQRQAALEDFDLIAGREQADIYSTVLFELLIDSPTQSGASASLLSLVGRRMEASGLRITQTQSGRTLTSGPLTEITVAIEAVGSIESLTRFLDDMAEARPLVTTQELVVNAPDPASNLSDLTIRLELSGYWDAQSP